MNEAWRQSECAVRDSPKLKKCRRRVTDKTATNCVARSILDHINHESFGDSTLASVFAFLEGDSSDGGTIVVGFTLVDSVNTLFSC
mmetsp:Transcript_57588/g.89641  ORF Transcript_57588/g.89641 Transcript_57588/m.89641 type:complete len:86 (+) Transcript_57588:87-344(+)